MGAVRASGGYFGHPNGYLGHPLSALGEPGGAWRALEGAWGSPGVVLDGSGRQKGTKNKQELSQNGAKVEQKTCQKQHTKSVSFLQRFLDKFGINFCNFGTVLVNKTLKTHVISKALL